MENKNFNQTKEWLIKIKDFTFYLVPLSGPRFLSLKPTILLFYFNENPKILENFNNFTSKIDCLKFNFGIINSKDRIVFPDREKSYDSEEDEYYGSVLHVFGHDFSVHSSTIFIYDRCKTLESIPFFNDFNMSFEDGKIFRCIEISEKSKDSLNENIIGVDDIENYLSKFDIVNGEIKIKYDLNELKEKLKFITEEIIDEYTEKMINKINKHNDIIIKNAII